ncbi:MAG: chromosome segregation protein SMC [Bacillota bacterium]|nr:chromosome segregation protein SMC [Bacillota bacterium]
MYLKKLVLAGFKSFGQRTELVFEPGITAIVGPNGSGKSNIADAIRWVLGEQSLRLLRGARVEDVIFGGSEAKKPLGLAEVSLTLDNFDRKLPLDFGEVTITRRVFRSGEGEYFINSTPCHLKDIHALFMDTGLGRDGYSLITQSDIESLLSVRPEDRRPLFEEAAGIVKYKVKKAKAIRKLEETEQNLVRVGDILAEIKLQLLPLREQAEKAERYQELKASLRRLEVALAAEHLRELLAHQERGQKEAAALEEERAAQAALLAGKEAELEAARLRLLQLDEAIEQGRRELLARVSALEKVESRLALAQEKLSRCAEEAEALAERKARHGQRWAEVVQLEKVQRERLALLQEEIREGRRKVAQRQENATGLTAELSACRQELERSRERFQALLQEESRLQKELQLLREQQEGALRREEALAAEGERLQSEKAACVEAALAAEQAVLALREKLAAGEAELEKAIRAQQAAEAEKRRVEGVFRQEEERWRQVSSRLSALEEMIRSHAGLHEGVQAVLKAASGGELQGIEGVAVDLIQVPREYERAIEVALGGAAQHIIVAEEGAAREAIRFLKERRAGRATFLPLDLVQPQEIPAPMVQRVRSKFGTRLIGVAADLVGCAPRYQRAVRYLLGRILVVRDLEAAVAVARELELRYAVVSLGGELVRPGGAITGGEGKGQGQSWLLAPRRELEELKEVLTRVERRREELRQRLARAEEAQVQSVAECERLRSQVMALHLELVGAEKDAASRRAEVERVERELQRWEGERTPLAQGREEGLNALARKEEEWRAVAAERERVQEELEALEARQQELWRRQSELQQEETSHQVLLARVQQEEADLQRRLAELERELSSLRAEGEALAAEEALLRERQAGLQAQVESDQREREALVEGRRLEEERLFGVQEEKKALAAEVAAWEEEIKAIRLRLDSCRNRAHELQLMLSRWQMELERLTGRLQEEYSLSLEEVLSCSEAISDRVWAQREIESLKRQLRSLEPVNLGAIEEYRALNQRYEFMHNQHRDLTEAKQALFDVIDEIEETTRRRFQEVFTAVEAEFSNLFRRLFGGGKAELVLTDPADLGATGIEIIAQPPGKKPQSLLLLSTGERTLTAIALLMAILKVKPAPFCVMDEVDAALDEVNLRRFTDLLLEMADQIQFLIITHRRVTMEAANILYGVTMEEGGVSRLISVRLEEAG